jgi:aspartate kinase
MIVMKFGGTSVGNADAIKNVGKIIKNREDIPIIIVSAIAGVTDLLIGAANNIGRDNTGNFVLIRKKHQEILKDLGSESKEINVLLDEIEETINAITQLNAESLDLVQSFGERISARIVAEYLEAIGVKSRAYDAFEIGMITNSNFGEAEPVNSSFDKLRDLDHVAVVTGFIGKDAAGRITTLGRGGSDYTAALIGADLNASEIQIWTDVDGVYSADPKIIEDAKKIEKISFNEVAELAFFGAKVLHPKTLLPAMDKNIPVRVLNTFNEGGGTIIVNEMKEVIDIVKAVTCKKNNIVINMHSTRMLFAHGFLARVFYVFDKYNIPVDMLATSEVSVSLTVDDDRNLDKAVEELRQISRVDVTRGKSIVCVVGAGLKNAVGVAGKVFKVVGDNNIKVEMISQGASEINISFVVNDEDAEKAVKCLHDEFVD